MSNRNRPLTERPFGTVSPTRCLCTIHLAEAGTVKPIRQGTPPPSTRSRDIRLDERFHAKWKWWIALALGGLVIYFGAPEALGRYIHGSYALAAAGVALIAILQSRPRLNTTWYWFAAWLALWGLADFAYNFVPGIIRGQQPLHVLGYGCASVFAVNMFRRGRSQRLIPVIDSAIITLATGLLVWNAAFYPRLGEGSLTDVLTMFSYPVLDLFLFGLFVVNAVQARKRSGSLWLTVAASGLLITVDVPFYWMGLSETYVAGLPIDALWVGIYVLAGAAALHPSAGATTELRPQGDSASTWALGVLAIAIFAPTAVLAMGYRSVDLPTTLVVEATISALVITRLFRTSRDKEEALREADDASEELVVTKRSFRLLAENAQDLIFRYRLYPKLGFDYVSPASTAVTGYAPERWYSDPDLWQRISNIRFADNAGSPDLHDGGITLPWHHEDGRIVWIDLVLTPVLEGERLVAVEGRARDVTQQVGESQTLETLRSQSEAILNSMGQGVINTDDFDIITFVNPAAADMLGWEQDDLIGQRGHETFHHSRRDGSPYPREECPIGRSFKDGAVIRTEDEVLWQTEDELFWRKDGSRFPVELVVTPLVGGLTSGAVVIFSDISERQKLEQRVRQSEKMEAFGQIAGGVAHDFNNLLSVIINYGEFLLESLESTDPRADDLREVVAAGERGARLTRQLLTFSRQADSRPSNISANDAITEVTTMLRRTIKESTVVELDLSDDLWDSYIDESQLEQVILNLAVNADQAMPHGGELKIRTRNLPARQEDFTDSVAIYVSDNGVGMPDEVRKHAFEPFYTTKDVDKGTGLGLATVHGIIEESGGSISCDTEVGEGTSFEILLPRSSQSALAAPAPPTEFMSGDDRTILVVEDEAAVLSVVTRLLQKNGYSPIAFQDAREALEFSKNCDQEIELLLTDVVMPGMSGIELASLAGLPVIYMTGYPNRSLPATSALNESFVIRKPFSEQQLLQSIGDVLGAERVLEVIR